MRRAPICCDASACTPRRRKIIREHLNSPPTKANADSSSDASAKYSPRQGKSRTGFSLSLLNLCRIAAETRPRTDRLKPVLLKPNRLLLPAAAQRFVNLHEREKFVQPRLCQT